MWKGHRDHTEERRGPRGLVLPLKIVAGSGGETMTYVADS